MNIDYKKTLELLNAFNQALRTSGAERDFYYEGKNLLASFQMSIFSDIKMYTADPLKLINENNQSLGQKIKAHLMQSVLSALSFFSFCVVYLRYVWTRKPVVAVYSIDTTSDKIHNRDGRVSYLYDYVRQNGESLLEFMHTVPSLHSLRKFLIRKSPTIYLESINFLASGFVSSRKKKYIDRSLLNFPGLEQRDADFLYTLYKKYKRRKEVFVISQNIYGFIYRRFTIQRFWSIDDTRHVFELLPELQKQRVKTYVFQHGHYTKYHTGFLTDMFDKVEIIKPQFIVVWNEYFKKELLRLSSYFSEEQILVGGEKRGVRAYVQKEIGDSIGSVLIPYETDAPKAEVKAYIEKFIQEGKTVYFKLRKDITKEVQLQQYGFVTGEINEKCIVIFDEKDILNKIDMVAGVYSTYLYDMLYLGVPVAVLDTSMDYGMGMVEGGLAILYSQTSTDGEIINQYKSIRGNIQHLYGNILYIDTYIKNFA
ncbi:MAG: hypothetical protein RJB39_126 [Candidatus Parcubacteria bacterium]|jgi:hypothetical protein